MAANDGILRPGWEQKLRRIYRGVTDAEIATINDQGLFAADLDRATIRRDFVNRTKWTEGSIKPVRGKKWGLIPENRKTSKGAYVRVGSMQEYMRDQETGWTANNPHVPTDKARVGGNYDRKISRKAQLRHIGSKGVLKAKHFTRSRTREKRIAQMIQAAKKMKFPGVVQVMSTDPTNLPPGYYKVKGKSLVLWRMLQPGPRRRKATHWHTKTMANPAIRVMTEIYYKRNAERVIREANLKG